MKNQLKIFYLTPEVSPFAKTGELADIAAAFPKYVKNSGHDIRVMMPNYQDVNERKYVLRDVIRLQGLKIVMNETDYQANGKSAFIPDSKVQIYFLDNSRFFGKCDPLTRANGTIDAEDAERFIFFSLGCLETLKLLYWQPDIIHCNDWQTALIPLLLKTVYAKDTFFKNTKTLLSIHNFFHQGVLDIEAIKRIGLPEPTSSIAHQLSDKVFSFLRCGMAYADMLTTGYDLDEPGLYTKITEMPAVEPVLAEKRSEVHHVTSGIDTQVWHAANARVLPFPFSSEDLSGKEKNKAAALEKFELTADGELPLVGLTVNSSSCESKVVTGLIRGALTLEVKLIVAGAFDDELKASLSTIASEHPDRFAYSDLMDTRSQQLMYAGCDIFIIPDSKDAKELEHRYCLNYGTVVLTFHHLAGSTGVEIVEVDKFSGQGLIAVGSSVDACVEALGATAGLYRARDRWNSIVVALMKGIYSWDVSIQKYMKLYQKLSSMKLKKL